MQRDLIAKVRAIRESRIRAGLMKPAAAQAPLPAPTRIGGRVSFVGKRFDAILIGSSTGGPPVLERLLTRLPADMPMPIVIAQHMPPMFTKSLAERLDQMCAVSVVHGDQELPLHPGTVYITIGGRHGKIARGADRKLKFLPADEPASALYKPSVNALFASGAEVLGAAALGIVLTGMGDDGLIGARKLRELGGTVLAQSAETCVVYGMPRAVVEASVATAHSPDEIAALLAGLTLGRSGTRQNLAARSPAA
jgi:two-component system chemotaxis response regulator CheB